MSEKSKNIVSVCSVLKVYIRFVWMKGSRGRGVHTCMQEISCWQEQTVYQ